MHISMMKRNKNKGAMHNVNYTKAATMGGIQK